MLTSWAWNGTGGGGGPGRGGEQPRDQTEEEGALGRLQERSGDGGLEKEGVRGEEITS